MLRKAFLKGKSLYNRALFPYTSASLKRRVVFIHIPKAAGTAVRIALGEPERGRRHLPWWVYQQASPKKFQEFYKFAFVRDPLNRAFSGYKYLKSGGNQMEDLSIEKYLKQYASFNDFVDGELVHGSMIYHPVFRPQSWYLCDWKGDVQVDYLGRFESMAADFEKVAEHLQLESFHGLPVVNKSSSFSEDFSRDTKKVVLDIYKDDYRLFGY